MNDGVFVRRLEPIEQERNSPIVLTDMKAGGSMILRKGLVLSVGPGKWIEGTWWYFEAKKEWEWLEGYRETPTVKPGDIVLFNARWNDLAHEENKGSGADGKGQLERPLSYRFDPEVHLIQEADIAGTLA